MFSRNSTFWHKIFWSENQLPNYRKGIRGAEKQNVFLTPWNYVISNILNNYPCLETLKSYYSHAWKSWFSHHRRILSSNSFFSRQKYLPPPFILSSTKYVDHFLSFNIEGQYIDLETKLSSCNFSQKTNGWICFSILTSRKYLKLEFRS